MKKNYNKLSLVLIISIIIKILGLIYKILTTRLLGLEGMRLISLITPLLALCLSLSSFSIQSVCNQNISLNITNHKLKTSTIMLSCLRVTLTSSSVVSIFMLLSFPLYKILYQEPFIYYPLLLTIPLLYFSNISGVMKGYLEANNKFLTPYLSNLIESSFKLFVTIFLLYLFKDFEVRFQIIICYLVLMLSELSSCIYLATKIKKGKTINLRQSTNKYEKTIFKQALILTLDSLVVTISGYITPFIYYYSVGKLGYTFLDATTYYALTMAYAIPLLINGQFTTLTLTKLIFPSVTRYRNNEKTLNSIINQALFLTLIFSIISFTLCYFEGEILLQLMYDNKESFPIVKKLSIVYLFLYFDPIFICILQAFNKEKSQLFITIFSQIISIIVIFITSQIRQINLMGYVIGISIGSIIKCLFLGYKSFKIANFNPNLLSFLLLILLSGIYIALCFYITSIINYLLITSIYAALGLFLFYAFYNKALFFHFDRMRT